MMRSRNRRRSLERTRRSMRDVHHARALGIDASQNLASLRRAIMTAIMKRIYAEPLVLSLDATTDLLLAFSSVEPITEAQRRYGGGVVYFECAPTATPGGRA